MAQLDTSSDALGLVVGLCQDSAAYLRLALTVSERGLVSDAVRAGGTGAAISAFDEAAGDADCGWAPWRDKIVRLDPPGADSLMDVHSEPLLDACFACLSRIPSGGAPWQGSWRVNALDGVLKALNEGGIILVVEAHSIDEQRDWARLLLRCGCSFVQTHGGTASIARA